VIKLGPEPFAIESDAWRIALKKANRNLKACLLDQRLVAGVGNIYADESLFEARLKPMRRARHLSRAEAERLRGAIVAVLTRAIQRRGSTIRDYVGGSGQQGGFQDEFHVYGCGGEACVACKSPIRRIVLAGRSTHFCPRCQK
jgi:formamidopyrimidine-DNA glycosylase